MSNTTFDIHRVSSVQVHPPVEFRDDLSPSWYTQRIQIYTLDGSMHEIVLYLDHKEQGLPATGRKE